MFCIVAATPATWNLSSFVRHSTGGGVSYHYVQHKELVSLDGKSSADSQAVDIRKEEGKAVYLCTH